MEELFIGKVRPFNNSEPLPRRPCTAVFFSFLAAVNSAAFLFVKDKFMSELEKKLDLRSSLRLHGLAGLWSLMKGFQLIYAGAVVSLAAAALCRTATFLLLRFFVDEVLAGGFLINHLYIFASAFLGLALFEGGASFLRGKLSARTAEGLILRLRNFLFDHIQRLSFRYHDHTHTGELIERVTSDVDTLRRFYSEQAVEIGRISALFIFNLIALVSLNTTLGLLSIVFIPFILLQSIWFFNRIFQAYERYQEQEARLSSTLQESVTAVRVVRAFARQEFETEKFERENWEKFQRGRGFIKLHSLYWPISDTLCTVQMLLIFYLGARMAIAGVISPGTYMAVAGMVIWIIWPLRNLGRIIVQASSALVSFKRVAHIIKEEPEVLSEGLKAHPTRLKGHIIFNNVCFEYNRGESVLHNISFAARPGELIALLGSTGSGKTTLVNLLPRFYEYTGGSLVLDGRELKDYPIHNLRRHIGIVEQEPFLFSRTIRENIIFGAGENLSEREIEEAAKAAAIHDVILSFPEGYDTLISERGVTLSGGQKQRIAIARTIIKNPSILILDDATSSVDSETEALIQEALSKLMEGRTSFVIAHRVQTVKRADKILVLDKGRILQEGNHRSLIREQGVYRKIFNLQSRIEEEAVQGGLNA